MNWLEKKLGKTERERFRNAVLGGLGVFLGLRYNEFLTNLLNEFIPGRTGLLFEGIILLLVTIGVVYLGVFIIKALDGK